MTLLVTGNLATALRLNRMVGAVSAALVVVAFQPASAQEAPDYLSQAGPLSVEVVTDELSYPWGLASLPDGSLLVTERDGQMRIVTRDGQVSDAITGVPEVAARGQGGLLDVTLDPEFVSNALIYFTYSEPGARGSGTSAARARLVEADDGEAPLLEDLEVIFQMKPKSAGGRHFGSRILFAPDNTLFITIGDRGSPDRAQDANDHAGSVVRINRDGSVPADNPFVGQSGVQPEIWSIGHRNAQGADIDPATGALWTVEHGARGGDEINKPEAGLNYGWPVISYGVEYSGAKIGVGTSAQGYEQPLYYWDPSIAPSGLAVYDGDLFTGWKGDLLVGALKYQMLVRLERDDQGRVIGEERLLEGVFGRIRDVEVAPDGAVYLLTDDDNGSILRITPAL